jgi:hypothetical protein
MMRLRTVLLAATAAGLAACATEQSASTEPRENRDCFQSRSVSGFSVVDEHNVRISVGASRSYTMHTNWNVNDLDWTQAIALRSDSSWICTGNVFGQVEVTGGSLGRTFPIQTITRDPDPAGQVGS